MYPCHLRSTKQLADVNFAKSCQKNTYKECDQYCVAPKIERIQMKKKVGESDSVRRPVRWNKEMGIEIGNLHIVAGR